MGNSLAIRNNFSMTDAETAAKHMAKSGFFADSRDLSQAVVKILAGQELGLGPFASMTGISIIKGRPALGANVMATLIKNDPRYDYRVVTLEDDVCSIAFFEGGQEIGVSTFTQGDARKAGTGNMSKFPRNMLFARAISNGAKWYTPGIFGGAPVYTPDELGAEIDEDGYVVGEVVDSGPQWETEPSTEQPKAERKGEVIVKKTPEQEIESCLDMACFLDVCVRTVNRYEKPHAVKNALKVLGFETFPRGTAQGAQRLAMYADLKKYASFRDAGMDQDRALKALADDLMGEAVPA